MNLKLNNKRTYLVGFAFMSIMLFWTIYDMLIAKMLIDNFGLNQTWSGVVMALDNVLALFMLPLFGRLSDKTKTKWGKRTPYIVIGTIIAAVLFVGVAFFDLYQQFAVTKYGFEPITEIVVDGKTSYQYLFNGTPIEHASNVHVKSYLAADRAKHIFEVVTSQNPGLLIGFIVVLFFVLLAMGIYRSPAVSLMPDVTPKPLRSKANAIINLLGTVGGGISYLLVAFLASGAILEKTGYVTIFAVTGLLMIALIAVFVFTVKENKWVDEMIAITKEYNLDSLEIDEEGTDVKQYSEDEKMPKDVRKSFILILAAVVLWFMGYNAATSKFSVYAFNHLGMQSFSLPPLVATLTATIAFIPIGIFSEKIGRRRMILIGISILTFALAVATFITAETKFLMFVIMALVGISWAAINVNSYPMVVEMSKHGNIGVYTGYYYTASMSAMIITPILSGKIMDLLGYSSLFVYSAIFLGLSFIPMFFVKHGEPVHTESIPEKREEEAKPEDGDKI